MNTCWHAHVRLSQARNCVPPLPITYLTMYTHMCVLLSSHMQRPTGGNPPTPHTYTHTHTGDERPPAAARCCSSQHRWSHVACMTV